MRLATWNINGLRARVDFLLHWLRERQPDVVGLQELKLTDEQFPHLELHGLGYRALTHGQPAWNGVAILTREGIPAVVTQAGLPGQEHCGARLLSADVGTGSDALSFTTIYCPNGKSVGHPDFPAKLAWLDSLATFFEQRGEGGRPAMVGGDFNVCPAPLDSWNEELLHGLIFHTDEERTRVRRLTEHGLTDTFRHLYPDTQAFSWWDYRGGAFHKREGLRIDLMLASPALTSRLRRVEIDRDYRKKKDGLIPSDHAPVLVELS